VVYQIQARNNWRQTLRSICISGLVALSPAVSQAQTYPPSCTITTPFSNAYYKAGTTMEIRVYSTDLGKSDKNGKITKVEFSNGKALLGQAREAVRNTYSLRWKNVPAGTYTLRAKATNDKGVSFTSTGVIVTVGTEEVKPLGMSAGKGKYLANIHQGSNRGNFSDYWNGVTSENACKWGSIEPRRGNYNWKGADAAYNFAKDNHMIFRYHAGLWAAQYPSWLLQLSTEEAKAAVVAHLKLIAERYPLADQIDLLNEQLGSHQKDNQKFRDLFGGKGTKENDFAWQIWLFEQGRAIFPNTKLVLNDYGLEGDPNAIKRQLELFKVLRDRGIVDGFGTQAHCFNVDRPSAATITEHLDLMATSGLPVYATELDMNGGIRGNTADEALQLASYKKAFPAFWEHPAVAGITLWGYVSGSTWISGTGIVSKEGVENPSMVWLKSYMEGRPDVGYPMGSKSK
jgi:GH35 family endo-1,4-beta-xylanase